MKQAEPARRQPGILTSLRSIGANLLALVHTRVELVVTELQEEKEHLIGMAVLAAVSALFLALGLLLVAMFIVVLFWDSHRVLAAGGVTVLYLALGAIALMRLRAMARASPPLFAATLAEFEKDLQLVRGHDE